MTYDVAIVGAGIVGLAHAVAAVRRGLSVIVVDRDARPIGASIRNFGFITVTGQRRGETWRRAMRSAAVWAEIAPRAGIAIEQRGLYVLARREEGIPILEAFAKTEMGEACTLLSATEAHARIGDVQPEALSAAMFSPHELRVESRDAIPKLVGWLADIGVSFRFSCAARAVTPSGVSTSRGDVNAETVIVCSGDDLATLYPENYERFGVTRCILQMLRLESPGFTLPAPLMTDLSLVRYRGYADLPESAQLRSILQREQAEYLEHGVHLIIVQSGDGSLVVGDSHHYADAPAPFADSSVESLILAEARATLGTAPAVRERWTGTYASAAEDMFRASPDIRTRHVVVTSGTGASTAFGIAEETFADLFGPAPDRTLP
ncbi:MAG: TIGR03364 family FAD-dependent oxidoreductase [Alphaproteobacteria bacterium]|nr:TIGR03364 family FAD-dependent oxidoreductase [Alphaproteobacteria bacterium]